MPIDALVEPRAVTAILGAIGEGADILWPLVMGVNSQRWLERDREPRRRSPAAG